MDVSGVTRSDVDEVDARVMESIPTRTDKRRGMRHDTRAQRDDVHPARHPVGRHPRRR